MYAPFVCGGWRSLPAAYERVHITYNVRSRLWVYLGEKNLGSYKQAYMYLDLEFS